MIIKIDDHIFTGIKEHTHTRNDRKEMDKAKVINHRNTNKQKERLNIKQVFYNN